MSTMTVAIESSSSSVSSKHVLTHRADDNLSIVVAFCKRALAGIKPALIRGPKAAAFALRNKAELYEGDRQRKLRANIAVPSRKVVFLVLVKGESIVFHLGVLDPQRRESLVGAGTIELSFQELLFCSGLDVMSLSC